MRTAFSQVFALVLALCATGAVPSQASPVKTAADRTTPAEVTVDLELVLAVDISYSMDPEEQALQREGYITALTSPEFLTALREGQHGRIVATYVEWPGRSSSVSSSRGR